MDVALYQPAIPPNTGNIGRLCVGMRATLHLVGPIAFDLSDKARRRAGLDYWQHLSWRLHPSPEAFLDWLGPREPWLLTPRGQARFDRAPFSSDDVLLFGNEQRGLPAAWEERWPHRGLRIPILGPIRAYNLANSVAMVLVHARLKTGAFDEP